MRPYIYLARRSNAYLNMSPILRTHEECLPLCNSWFTSDPDSTVVAELALEYLISPRSFNFPSRDWRMRAYEYVHRAVSNRYRVMGCACKSSCWAASNRHYVSRLRVVLRLLATLADLFPGVQTIRSSRSPRKSRWCTANVRISTVMPLKVHNKCIRVECLRPVRVRVRVFSSLAFLEFLFLKIDIKINIF